MSAFLRIKNKDTANKSILMRFVPLYIFIQGALLMVRYLNNSVDGHDSPCSRCVPFETPSSTACSREGILGSNLGIKILTHFCIFNVVSFLNSRQIMAMRR